MAQEIADSTLLDTWGSSGAKIEPDISKIIEGWQLGEQPPHEYMNWLQNTFGSKLNHILKNGIANWNNETEYLAGSSVQHNGNVWICKAANTNSEPTDANANWDKIPSLENLALTVDTINDFPTGATMGDTCIVKDLNRGGIFIYDSTKVSEHNGGTNFNGWVRQFSGAVNVKWFGAAVVGDSTASIQAAINNSSGEVSLGDGNIFSVSRLVGRSNLKLSGKSTLDFSGNATYAEDVSDPLIKFVGKAGTPILVTADVTNGAKIITVASTSGILAGDVIEIATPGYNGGFVDTSVEVHNGELVMVERVLSTTQLSLSDPVIDEGGYTVSNGAQIRKVTPIENVEISSEVTILGKGRPSSGKGDNGIVFFYGKNVAVHCKFLRVDLAAVRFEGCYQYEASECVIVHDKKGTNETINYGIVPSGSSKYGKVFRNYLSNMRHGVVTSHLSNALGLNVYGVVRELDIFDNDIRNNWHAGISTHNDAEFIRIKSNRVVSSESGINIREKNVEVSGNTISFCIQGIYLSGHPKKVNITSNILQNIQVYAVYSSFTTVRAITDLNVSWNIVTNTPRGITIQLPDIGSTHSRISINNNTLTNITGPGGAAAVIRKLGATVSDLVIANNTIENATNSAGISVSGDGIRVLIEGNKVLNVTGNSFTTIGTFVDLYGKGNYGANWSGQDALTNSSTLLTDNTWF